MRQNSLLSGYPQKIGGWIEATSNRALGACRQMWNWITSYTDNFLAVGTNLKVYIEVGGIYYDITPLANTFSTPTTDNCISTTEDSNDVLITITTHGCEVGTYITISGVTGNPGGIGNSDFNKEHIVTEVVDNNNFKITTFGYATSTASGLGGTAIVVACQINPGFAIRTAGYGWGTGTWNGNYGWGLASPTPVFLPQRDWWFDNFDNDLVMNIRLQTTSDVPTGGPIYYWERGTTVDPSGALAARAISLSGLSGASNVPDAAGQILISQNDKHLLAFGCTPFGGGDYDPLLIRWASQDDPQYWNVTTGLAPSGLPSTAGFLRVSRGSRIVRAIPTRQEIVVLTDTHIYSLQFLGTADIFGLQELTDNISIISPRSVATANNIVFWMGVDKFYRYDGRVQTLPCTLREHVFKDINQAQADQIICGTNEGFNEIWWFYPSSESDYNNKYVIYNHLDNIWYYGNLPRTAWLDTASRDVPSAFNYVPGVTEINYDAVVSGIQQAATRREPARTLFVTTTVDGRALGDINDSGDPAVTSADALAYLKWADDPDRVTADERAWIEEVLNPYMLANPDTYADYLTVADISILYEHEKGVNDADLPMESYIQSSDQDIGDGEQFMLTRRLIPDINFNQSTVSNPEVSLTVRSRDWPGSNFQNDPSDTKRVVETSVGRYTNQVFIRARGRQMALKISSDQLNVQWQLGDVRLDARPDGRR